MKFRFVKADNRYTAKSKGINYRVERNNVRDRRKQPAYKLVVLEPGVGNYNSATHEGLYFTTAEQAQDYALRIESGEVDWRSIVQKYSEAKAAEREQSALKSKEAATDFIKRVHGSGIHIQDFLKLWEEFSHWQGVDSSEVYRLADDLKDIPLPKVHIFVEMFAADVEKIEPYLREEDAVQAFEASTGESYKDFVDDKVELSQNQEGTTVYYCDILRPFDEVKAES